MSIESTTISLYYQPLWLFYLLLLLLLSWLFYLPKLEKKLKHTYCLLDHSLNIMFAYKHSKTIASVIFSVTDNIPIYES